MDSNIMHRQKQLNFDQGIGIDLQCNVEFKKGKVYFNCLNIHANEEIDIPSEPKIVDRNGRWKICKIDPDGRIEYFENKYTIKIIKQLQEWVKEIEKTL